MTAAKGLRVLLGAAGVGVMAYGAWGFATAPDIVARPEIGEWLIAGIIVHDALLAPTVFVISAAAYRTTGVRLRGRLAALLLIGGSLLLISLPSLMQKGSNPNHTVQPLDYTRNISALLAALAAVVVLLSSADALRNRRHRRRRLLSTRDPKSAQPEPESLPQPQPQPPEPEPARQEPEPDEPALEEPALEEPAQERQSAADGPEDGDL